MTKNLTIILAVLVLAFFVSTSSGLASVSSIQEKLREVQLKLIKERIKLIQESILDLGKKRTDELRAPLPPAPAPVPTREELEASINAQVLALERVIASLRPRALDENVARIEKRIAAINEEFKTATGERLRELQAELVILMQEYTKIQQEVSASITDAIKERQAIILREQIRLLEEKIRTLPRPVPAPVSIVSSPEKQAQFNAIQEQIEKIRLKILQEQIRAIQGKIQTLQNQ